MFKVFAAGKLLAEKRRGGRIKDRPAISNQAERKPLTLASSEHRPCHQLRANSPSATVGAIGGPSSAVHEAQAKHRGLRVSVSNRQTRGRPQRIAAAYAGSFRPTALRARTTTDELLFRLQLPRA